MRTIGLKEFLSNLTKKSPGTVADRIATLQAANLIAKGERGRYGGVDLSESDLTSAVLSLIVDFPRGADIGAEVRRLRSLPTTNAMSTWLSPPASATKHVHAANKFLRPLRIMSTLTFGDALDSLIADFRAGTYGEWAKGAGRLSFELQHDGALATIFVDRGGGITNSVALFYERDQSWRREVVSRNVRMHHEFFSLAAHALEAPT
jgi:hypothetical protein